MVIRILLTKCTEKEQAAEEDKLAFRFQKDRITIGSERKHDIYLSNKDTIQVSIFKKDATHYYLQNHQEGILPVKINETEIQHDPIPISNGDIIQIGRYTLHFSLEFDRVGHRRKPGWIVSLSAAIILLILVLETGVIVALPRQVAKQELWGLEVMRQRTLELLDGMRSRCSQLSEGGNDNLSSETVKLIHQELDNLAVYLRKSITLLNIEQVTTVHQDIGHFGQILDDLEAGNLFPEKEIIDLDPHLKELINPKKFEED